MQICASIHRHFARGVKSVFVDFGDECLDFDDWGLGIEAALCLGEVADASDHLVEVAARTVRCVGFLIVSVE